MIILLITFISPSFAQNTKPKKVRFSGFLEYLNNTWIPADSLLFPGGSENWQNLSVVYNRLNFWWYPVKGLEFHAGMRNNFEFGPLIAQYNRQLEMLHQQLPQLNFPSTYARLITTDNGLLNLTWDVASGNSYVLYSTFDRLYLKWTLNKFELTVGRQRINWGENLIWNPNDIFNAYNYFDFSYVERQGVDAVLMQFYTGDFSSLQLGVKVAKNRLTDNETQITAAAMYRFNKWNYDFQFFGGVMNKDVTAGLGWAGNIGGAGFTGEISWFRDRKNFKDTTDVFVGSIDVNYTFGNQIFLMGSVLYNSAGTTGNAGMGPLFTFNTVDAKSFSRARFDLFGQIGYPATPLINLNLASIFNPYDKSVYVGPSVTFSLTDNISLLLMGQLFFGNPGAEFGSIGQMAYLDLKWSF
ncbi:MAG: hypothetical protein GXO86_00660 [Chlorobi bacterium]|nr:hypothetical protein [Chlorobiota bacterium]